MTPSAVPILLHYLGISFLLFVGAIAQAQELVLAFDKTLARSTSLDGMARAQMLVRNMAKADVKQAMFLIRTKDVTPKTVERLAFYDDAGQLLVNKGAKYFFLSRHNVYNYEIDILKANVELAQYINYHQHVYFPYLYEGGDSEAVASLQDFLAGHGYQPTYVTYQASDDYLDQLYQARIANNKQVNIKALEKVYIDLLVGDIIAYTAKAHLLLGYHPRQVILLHENDLAAYFIIGLIDALHAQGFSVIAPEKIFSDPIANPFFNAGYSATGYMQAVTGIADARRESIYETTSQQQEKVHRHLSENGLGDLIPQP